MNKIMFKREWKRRATVKCIMMMRLRQLPGQGSGFSEAATCGKPKPLNKRLDFTRLILQINAETAFTPPSADYFLSEQNINPNSIYARSLLRSLQAVHSRETLSTLRGAYF